MSSPNKALRRALGNFELSSAPVQDEFVLSLNIPKWSIWAGDVYLSQTQSEINQKKKENYEKFGAFAVNFFLIILFFFILVKKFTCKKKKN